MKKVFFDASVLFSALYSQTGASYKLVQLTERGYIYGVVTETIVEELEQNLRKLKKIDTADITHFIVMNRFIVREKVSREEIKPFVAKVHEKDAHVLAAAVHTGCEYLVTLDKKHLNNEEVRTRVKELHIVSPAEALGILTVQLD